MRGKRRDKGEGSIYQRKSDGLWLGRYTPERATKPKYVPGKTELDVKKKLKVLKKEVIKNDYVEIQKITVEQYMTRWLEEVKMNELKPKALDALGPTLKNQI